MHSEHIEELDVRPIITAGGSPMGLILEAAGRVAAGEQFRVIAPFEPKPLYAMLKRQGFSAEVEQADPGCWRIRFARLPEVDGSSGGI
jgi:uncharacterized protein (DUF2249 family)